MARKNFKSGLGELITNSNIELEKEQDSVENSDNNEKLHFIINQLKQELHLWRAGKLTVDSFTESLKEHNLQYDAENNTFTKIE